MIKRIGVDIRDKITGESWEEFFIQGENGRSIFIERGDCDDIPFYQIVGPSHFKNDFSGKIALAVNDMYPRDTYEVVVKTINYKSIKPIEISKLVEQKGLAA